MATALLYSVRAASGPSASSGKPCCKIVEVRITPIEPSNVVTVAPGIHSGSDESSLQGSLHKLSANKGFRAPTRALLLCKILLGDKCLVAHGPFQ